MEDASCARAEPEAWSPCMDTGKARGEDAKSHLAGTLQARLQLTEGNLDGF